jgi:hypothetical protein
MRLFQLYIYIYFKYLKKKTTGYIELNYTHDYCLSFQAIETNRKMV